MMPDGSRGAVVGGRLRLVNAATGVVIADSVDVALSRRARRKGLLGRDAMAPASAMVLAPCAAIHTCFMRFAIDVVFVSEDGRALDVVANLGPWRAWLSPRAHAAIEMPAGSAAAQRVVVGDVLYLMPPDGGRIGLSAAELRERLP